MNKIYLLILIYVCSALISWLYFFISYSKIGKYHGNLSSETEEGFELACMFIPLWNTIACVISWFMEVPWKKSERKYKKAKRTLTSFILHKKKF